MESAPGRGLTRGVAREFAPIPLLEILEERGPELPRCGPSHDLATFHGLEFLLRGRCSEILGESLLRERPAMRVMRIEGEGEAWPLLDDANARVLATVDLPLV